MVPKINEYSDHSIKWEHTTGQSNWSANIDELKKSIDEIRANSDLPFVMESHDIHHYSMSYFTIVIIISVIYVCWQKFNALTLHMAQLATANIPMPQIENMEENANADEAIV